jgi:hypothetical protein
MQVFKVYFIKTGIGNSNIISFNSSKQLKDLSICKTINGEFNVQLTFMRYAKATLMNWFNMKERSRTTDDKKLEMIRKKLSVIDKLSDYDVILKKMNEVDILKRLLLNEVQAACFDYLEKPMNLNSDNMFSKSFNYLIANQQEDKKNIIKEFAELFYTNKDDKVNHKLYFALDEEIRNEIDQVISNIGKITIVQ